jgi:hypothetical protein
MTLSIMTLCIVALSKSMLSITIFTIKTDRDYSYKYSIQHNDTQQNHKNVIFKPAVLSVIITRANNIQHNDTQHTDSVW